MPTQTPNIRPLSVADYQKMMALWRRAGLHSIRPEGRDSRAAIARQLASGAQTILGLEIDAQLVGVVIATHDSRKGWINRLAVDPAHRRQGYARRLIEAAERVLRAQGMHVIAALIEGDNPASLKLFREAGYVEFDAEMHYVTKRDSDAA
jgi:ribosomal protein S18 acetylase RimI-like enzyme